MSVRLAAQVLSRSVGLVMQSYGSEECQETAKFILYMDRFFDCLNGRSASEAAEKKKPDLRPYTHKDDPRFEFFDEFLTYLNEWKASVLTRQGNFTQIEKSKMFLTHQTFKGLVMTIKSFKEVVPFLFDNGVDFVLSNKFCQDPLEAHFGRHRGFDQRSDNPTLHVFGYQENKIRLQRSLAMIITPKGNVEKKKRKNEPVVISTSPLKKRKL
ncbi:uncharacterized protein [Littorina saxatilis]|uniref:Transposable element P transposase-like GTP-binding insertion domain-containing protein n=1 Tax=Littorina saxatilis TaxID=31220 RepID=A0AAN9BWE0_9CAEN